MKKLFSLLFVLFFLAACASSEIVSEQIGENNSEQTENAQANETSEEIAETNEETEQTSEIIEPAKVPKLASTSNMSLSSQDENDLYLVKGTQHTIEVVDVTENEDACLIKVDGVQDLINLDETKTINGVKITVLEVYAMRSVLQDNDICQIIAR